MNAADGLARCECHGRHETGSKGVVHVVDDDVSVLRMLRLLIDSLRDVQVHTHVCADDFIAVYRPAPCECLVSDIRMPGTGGLELQQRLAAAKMTLPVIFLSGCADIGTVVEAMKRGAFDYLEKPFSPPLLLEKCRQALDASRRLHAQKLARDAERARLGQLTAKERQIARLVVEGHSSREISQLLAISVRTVENHRAHIMEKLDAHSVVALVRLLACD